MRTMETQREERGPFSLAPPFKCTINAMQPSPLVTNLYFIYNSFIGQMKAPLGLADDNSLTQ